MKFDTYKKVRDASMEELLKIDPDDYTDEEYKQLQLWLIQAEQEAIPKEHLLDMSDEEVALHGFDNPNVLNKVVGESSTVFSIDGKKIVGQEIITWPEFSIVKEDGKSNFYRIMH